MSDIDWNAIERDLDNDGLAAVEAVSRDGSRRSWTAYARATRWAVVERGARGWNGLPATNEQWFGSTTDVLDHLRRRVREVRTGA